MAGSSPADPAAETFAIRPAQGAPTGVFPLWWVPLPVAIVAITVAMLGGAGYRLLHVQEPGLATSMTSALLRMSNDAMTAITLGSLATAAVVVARRSRTAIDPGRDLRVTRVASGLWLIGALASIAVDGADQAGLPLAELLKPGAIGYLITASYLPGAWIASACCALIVFVASWLIRAWTSTVVLAAISALACLAPVMVGQVLVGPNHDFAGDAAIFGTPAAAIAFGAGVTMLARWRALGPPGPRTAGRFRLLILCCTGVAVAADGVIYYVQSAGRPVTSATGLWFLTRILVPLVTVAVLFLGPRGLRAVTRIRVGVLVAAGAITLGITDAMVRVPPPVFFAPSDAQDLYLGYSVNTPMTPVTLFLDARVNILFLVLSLVGAASYLWGVRRLHRRGDRWPAGRTIAWLLGWGCVILTTSSGVGPYSSASYAVHMALHMSLNMLCPLLLVLGGPITLALRACTAHPRSHFAGPHEWIATLLHSRLTHLSMNPIYVLIAFVGSYYAIYLTPFFGWAMRYHWAHQGMTLHYLLVGYVFYALVIGVDEAPRPLPHLGKLGLVLAAMPFHAFFGVIVMTASTPLAGLYYRYLDPVWLGSLIHDQQVAGGIAWGASELPLLVVVLALMAQWARQDAKETARLDRHLDSGMDGSYDAYNRMLAAFAARPEAPAPGPGPSHPTGPDTTEPGTSKPGALGPGALGTGPTDHGPADAVPATARKEEGTP